MKSTASKYLPRSSGHTDYLQLPFFIFTSFHTDCLGSLTDKGGFERKQPSEYLFSVSPLFPLSVFFSLLPREAPDFYQRIIMLNNMDLNAKDSFYPQFDNCNASSLGMENGARKDNQEVYVEAAERGAPAQFGHGESTVLQERSVECACTAGFGCFFVLFFRPLFFFLSVSNYRDTTNKSTVKSRGLHFVASYRDIPARPCVYVTPMPVYSAFISTGGPFKRKEKSRPSR